MNSRIHPVIRLMEERFLTHSQPGNRRDEFKLGLAIEGGGMRGVVASAMASALHFLGLVDVFDAVYGSSAGALAGTFFVAGQMPLGPTIFYENINNSKFIDLKRWLTRDRYVMDLDFLIYHVLVKEKPMNWKAVVEGRIPLKTVVSSVNQRRAVSFDRYRDKDELFTLLKASANIPFVAGPPIAYGGDLLFDASVYESIPYQTALADGCTHVLALLSRPQGRLRGKPSLIARHVIARKMRQLKPGLDEDFLDRPRSYREALDFLAAANQNFDRPPFVFSLRPSRDEAEVRQLEKNRRKLVAGATSGMAAVMRVLAPDANVRFHEVLYPVNKVGLIPVLRSERKHDEAT